MAKTASFLAGVIPRSFSLRALFLVVTAICIWLGYEMSWIRARRDFREQNPTAEFFMLEADSSSGAVPKRAPGLLWLFGEEGVYAIGIPTRQSDARIEANGQQLAPPNHKIKALATRLFPEAEISVWIPRE